MFYDDGVVQAVTFPYLIYLWVSRLSLSGARAIHKETSFTDVIVDCMGEGGARRSLFRL